MRYCTSGSIGWPMIHANRDIRKVVTKVRDLRFRVVDSAGLEGNAASDTVFSLTSAMTWNVLTRSKFAIFLINVRFTPRLLKILEEKFAILIYLNVENQTMSQENYKVESKCSCWCLVRVYAEQ
ncbi:putative GTPase Der [Iris pallida]|uniref:GTPase Der n=1 Tax=Iris pallida TaxID=29817 RepID=A0AAX6FNP7_IRIPA|nr:putative GTPase Der [Iris pallida]